MALVFDFEKRKEREGRRRKGGNHFVFSSLFVLSPLSPH
jgi:hypothetical protein